MKKSLSILLFVCLCFSLFATETVNPFRGSVSVVLDMSLVDKKFKVDSLALKESAVFTGSNGSLTQKAVFSIPLKGNSDILFDLTYDNKYRDAEGFYVSANFSFDAAMTNWKFQPQSIQATVDLVSHKDRGTLIVYGEYSEDMVHPFHKVFGGRIGGIYTFGEKLEGLGLIAGLQFTHYNTTPITLNAWADAVFYNRNGLKIENSVVGASFNGNYNMMSFEPSVEYRYSYNKNNYSNGVYLSLNNCFIPIGSSMTLLEASTSFHKTEEGVDCIVNYIYFPITVLFVKDSEKHQSLYGLDCCEYVYDADNRPEENGFFLRFKNKLDLNNYENEIPSPYSYLTMENDLDVRFKRENKKVKIDVFNHNELKYSHRNSNVNKSSNPYGVDFGNLY